MKSFNEIIKGLEACLFDVTNCGDCPYSKNGCKRSLKKDCLSFIKQQQQEVERLKAKQSWIPVSERLPEKGGRYLVTEKYYNDKCTRIIFDHYISEIGRFASNQIIAWQPLPEPYKEEN